jgi:DNA-binding transcriptional MerR regulator
MESWLTVGDVARALDVGPDVVRAYERRGKLHAIRTAGGVRLFSKVEVYRFARERLRQSHHRSRARKRLRRPKKLRDS